MATLCRFSVYFYMNNESQDKNFLFFKSSDLQANEK